MNDGKKHRIHPIKNKILVSLTVLFFMFFLASFFSYYQLSEIRSSSERLPEISELMIVLHDLSVKSKNLESNLEKINIAKFSQYEENLMKTIDGIKNDAKVIENMSFVENKVYIDELIKNTEELELLMFSEEKQKQLNENEIFLQAYSLFNGIEISIEGMFSYLKKELNTISVEQHEKISKSLRNYLIIQFVIFVVVVAGSFVFLSKITSPIKKLYKTTQQLEKGNFNARADIKTGDELEDLGNTLNKAIETLGKTDAERKQIDKAKTEFMSITSHELRSPMTPMRAQLQMLLGEYYGKLNKKQKNSIDIVLRNTTRLDNIIQDFLEISRIEAARLKFKFKRTNLKEHIERLVEEMKGFMPEKKIKIEAKIKKLPTIDVDPDRTMQVLRNLINNAKKFSPENSKIVITAEKKNNMIEFSVKDQGIGISPEDQRKLFEPFFQAEQTMYREHGGTGLGLAICKGIIEAQNGRIWIESQKGKGTTFFFTVPLKPVKEIKSIKLLFSEGQNHEKELKKLFVEYLGPLGEHEFEKLRNNLNYENINAYILDLKKKSILSEEKIKRLDSALLSIFNIKRKTSITQEVKKKYIEILGPLGGKRIDSFKKIDSKNILGDINYLEKKKIIDAVEASRLRDYMIHLFNHN
ncbi:HAMP domain-containing protein [Candidatus Woesearchaeota archaeon]|nr:HAMP domain-containing protein [Candidatus Woesearchaeota archaeon]